MTALRRFLLACILIFQLLPPLPASAASAQAGDGDWLYRESDIPRDPAWRFGTLPNGLRYALRRNPLPAGQVSIRLRINAGALHEEDGEGGWAHFVEHMLFRGTRNFPDREARHIWQQLGASFGSDTNATTGPTQTVYQLDLPRADRAALDRSLHVLADMASAATFAPEAVEAERRVILAEKARRPELTSRLSDLTRGLFYAGLRIGERDTIGTEETLGAATSEGLKAFHRRWYRPERATLVMVGDADPDIMEALVRARFGGWEAAGPPPGEPDPGAIAERGDRVATLAYPGAPSTASLVWLRPFRAVPHTLAREREHLEELLAARIINRRLEAHARNSSEFISASVGLSRTRAAADMTGLTVSARNGGWRDALGQAFAILRDALRAPPSQAEIARELENIRATGRAAVQGDATIPSQARAQQLVGAIDAGSVVAAAETAFANFERNAALMTPERVGAAMAGLFSGIGPRMILLTPEPVAGGEAAVAAALAAAEQAGPAERRDGRPVSLADLPPLGPPGREVSREVIADLGVTIVRFANGSSLTFKPTPHERGAVEVQLRFGSGLAGLPPDRPSLAWLAGLVGPSGLSDLDLDALERMMTGHRIGLSFGVDEDAFVLSGKTNPEDLADQLRLLSAKLAYPRWDPRLFARFQAAAIDSFDLHFSSAAARAARELGGVVRPGDARWRPVEREELAAVTPDRFQSFFAPLLAAGPVNVVVVGDTELERVVDAMRRTVAALPPRPPAYAAPGSAAVQPPMPDPRPRIFTHRGDPNQAYAVIGWSTLGGTDRRRERRALALAANMLQVRLFDRLREVEGATYSPAAVHSASESFPDWGIFYAAAEIRPEHRDSFFRIAREVVADLAAHPALPDEFERAQNPVVSGIERRMATNGYWMAALEPLADDPASAETARTYLSDYRSMTAAEVRDAVARYVTDAGDWSMLVLPPDP